MQVDIQADVFNDIYLPHLTNTARVQIYYGGSASGKSVFLAQRCVYDLMAGGRNYLVCRQVGRTIQKSVATEIKKVISAWGVRRLYKINKTDGTITCANGYQCIFAGLDDAEKLKSITPEKGAITDVWVEEATETAHDSVQQLLRRQRGGDDTIPKRLTMSFNPILRTSWIYTEHFAPIAWADDQREYRAEELSILKTTYKDNRFIGERDIHDLENTKDPYFYSVYTLGEWGVLGNLIFKNWRVEDLSEKRATFDNLRFGLDFGFSDDPAAMPVCHYDQKHKIIYIFNEFYERGLTNDKLARSVLKFTKKRHPVTCDCAEPKSIAELQQHGVDARAAAKGADSVMHGIQWLQQHEIVVDSRCINMRNELAQYKFAEDKNGNALPRPVDKNNHLIDGLRYAFEQDMRGGGFGWGIA